MRQNRPDEIVLGLAFIGRSGNGKAGKYAPSSSLERGGVNVSPLTQACDRLSKEVVRKETAPERDVETHVAAISPMGTAASPARRAISPAACP